ncbi:MAG: exo-alpha-sialidase [Caldilineaceae bacterium]|nr:exo-alpha-sialidase [Caldilineaceae bacterium]
MGRELTSRHSHLFDNRVSNLFRFASDIHAYGKFSELVSFMVWEVLHKLRLFPKGRYLKFSDHEPLSLEGERLGDLQFSEKATRFFASKGLRATRSDHNWQLLFIQKNREILGCLNSQDRDLYKSSDQGKTITLVKRFPATIKSIFVSSKDRIFVCVKGAVYSSSDHGLSFRKAFDMGSTESFFRHNNAITETPDGTLVVGEYGNVWEKTRWKVLAYLYFSFDNGETWQTSDFLIKQGINKHVHLVKYSKSLDRLFVADGDNKKKLWLTDSSVPFDLVNASTWKPVNKFHIQMGGYTSVVESGRTMLFGTDYQGGTNFLVSTKDGKHYDKRIVPDPYRRSPIDNMVQRRSKRGSEIWANLPYSTTHTKCLLMYTTDGGETWHKVIEYDRATHKVWIISSSNEVTDELYLSIENLKNADRVVYKIAD